MSIRERLHSALGQSCTGLVPLAGGCIAEVFSATLDDGLQVVIKSGNPGCGLDLEARMLTHLASETTLPIPEIFYSDDTLLVLDRLPGGDPINTTAQRHAADLIAALHNLSADYFGFDYDTLIGGLHQPNPKTTSWIPFFRDHRLFHITNESYKVNHLSLDTLSRLENFSETLDKWLDEPPAPSLIHGDLWGGNILCHSNKITGLIDPAIYFAHAEIELAFSTLFSTFNQTFFDRYREHRPIAPGFFEERLDIYNLYPLLVHTRLFGGHYVSQVEQTLKKFGY